MDYEYNLKLFRYFLFWRFQYAKRSFWSKILTFDFKNLIYNADINPKELSALEKKLMYFNSFKKFEHWKKDHLKENCIKKGEFFNKFEQFVRFLKKNGSLVKNPAVINFICILEIIFSWEDEEYGSDTFAIASYAISNSLVHKTKTQYDFNRRIPESILRFYPAYIGYSQNFGYFAHDLLKPFDTIEILESIKYEPDVIIPFYDIHLGGIENFVLRNISLYLYKIDNEPSLTDEMVQKEEKSHLAIARAAKKHKNLKNKALCLTQNYLKNELNNNVFGMSRNQSDSITNDMDEKKLILIKRVFAQIKKKLNLQEMSDEDANELIDAYTQLYPIDIRGTGKRNRAFGLVLWDYQYIYEKKRIQAINDIHEIMKYKDDEKLSESYFGKMKIHAKRCIEQNKILKLS